jgi:hypothetical protein
MAHSTPLIGIQVPDLGDAAHVPAVMDTAFAKMERYGVVPCLSSARPTSPHIGMTIYETNTGVRRVWTGAVWKVAEGLLLTSGGQMLGAAINTTNARRIHADSHVGTTNSSGEITIPIPAPAFTTINSIQLTSGDVTVNPIVMGVVSYTLSSFVAQVFTSLSIEAFGNIVLSRHASTICRVNYVVYGQ